MQLEATLRESRGMKTCNLVPEKTLTLTKLLYCDESEMSLYGLLSGLWAWLELVNIN